jgi:hypothetical protein
VTGPLTIATPEQAARLRGYIVDALHAQDDEDTARTLARHLDRGEWRVISEFEREDGEIVLTSLRYLVQVQHASQWVSLLRVPWSPLGLNLDQVLYEHRELLRQHRDGTFPGGLFDA